MVVGLYNIQTLRCSNYICLVLCLAGHYGMTTDKAKPCLIYTTFSGKIYIYLDITLPSILPSNLLLTMEKMVFFKCLSVLFTYMELFPIKWHFDIHIIRNVPYIWANYCKMHVFFSAHFTPMLWANCILSMYGRQVD